MKIAVKHQIFEDLNFKENQPKTSGFIDFSTSNIQISHADACVRRRAGLPSHMVRSTLCEDVPWGSRRPDSRHTRAMVEKYAFRTL